MTDILPIVWSSRLKVFLPEEQVSDRSASRFSTPPLSSTISQSSHTDKILLPPSTLESLLSQISNDAGLLPSPLLFKLTNPLNKKVTHVGVREFSAEEGTVQVPAVVARNLGLQNSNDILFINLVSLPKGTSLTLKTSSTGELVENVDWKSLLESRLHGSFTALTKGDVLTVSHPSLPGKNIDFTIEKLEPTNNSHAVCIIDTDLDLEVIEVNDGNSNGSRETVSGSIRGQNSNQSSVAGRRDPIPLSVNEHPVNVKGLQPSEVAYFSVAYDINDNSLPLEVSLDNISVDDSSSLVMFMGLEEANISPDSFLWSNLNSPGTSLTVSSDDPFLEKYRNLNQSSLQAIFYVKVISYQTPASFVIQAKTEAVNYVDSGQESSSNTSKCTNCLQMISIHSFARHVAFCERNNILCPEGCGRVFSRREGIPTTHWHCHDHNTSGDSEFSKKLHSDWFHTAMSCPGCGSDHANHILLSQHRATNCPAKLHICRFCHILLPQELASAADFLQGLTGHESYCGNRTTDCEICKRVVRLKELQTHLEFHRLDRLREPAPILCSNANCPRLITSTSSNVLGLCGICYGPLHSTLLDSDGSKLKQRIERRYVIQLTRGCGKPWCMNEHCASTRPKKRSIAEIMSTDVKFLMAESANKKFWFCVDETATKRKLFVQFQSQNGIFSDASCARAIEQAKGNESEAVRWLESNYT
ncbi:polyubiquitin-binding protein UFD1 [Sugiyamaella lignohabitans]|uniref:Polyubiquitin-binding protein UFD1 n=1 Tax=Sugiyamaella lignohabitans TaxID=796027 RepID=A0A161HH00_9ASCO|nr:polyubiquitin-binding protein UFD1 [Sugiyamaella lignohabitans]ANB15130.1 polyubiquitin-binding protein UFD1 [Sugiyamaella lignohabitans]